MELDESPPAEEKTIEQEIRRAERLLKHAERDMMICNLYLSGSSIKEIGTLSNLSRQRIYQIVKQYDLERPAASHLNREQIVGVVIDEDDKKALRAEAEKQGVSMSKWTLNLIKDKLKDIRTRERLKAMQEEG